jgi:hypothetical protein
MPKGPGQVWLRQADSDRIAGQALGRGNEWLYCQAVSKYQQAVEKAVKGIVSDLQAGDVRLINISRKHDRSHRALLFTEALLRLPRSRQNREVNNLIFGLLNRVDILSGIRALDALVPTFPAQSGYLHPRNTEYPYQQADSTWRAPADTGSFDRERDVERFRSVAEHVFQGARRILSAIARRPK